MEALRRLRRSSTDTNVDRRLVTNVLLSFLTTPREDAKRFEMLSLLATVLSWTDPEREKAGLQRAHGPTPRSSSSFWSRSPSASPAKPSAAELDKQAEETEVRCQIRLLDNGHSRTHAVLLTVMGRVSADRGSLRSSTAPSSSATTLHHVGPGQPDSKPTSTNPLHTCCCRKWRQRCAEEGAEAVRIRVWSLGNLEFA
jgi:hypothetical protein